MGIKKALGKVSNPRNNTTTSLRLFIPILPLLYPDKHFFEKRSETKEKCLFQTLFLV